MENGAETAIMTFTYEKQPERIIISLSSNPLIAPHLMIRFNANHEGMMNVILQDDKGVIIKKENISAQPGVNSAHIHVGDISLTPGIYYLICTLRLSIVLI